MLSARSLRRATSSVLRRPISGASPPSSSLRCLLTPPSSVESPPWLALQSGARSFAQGPLVPSSADVIERLKTLWKDPGAAREVFADIRQGDGYKMTDEAASTLLWSFSKHKSIDDCVELWTYCQQQGVQPDASSRCAAFSALCDAHELARAVEVFESLFRQKIDQPAWVYGRAMHIGTELQNSHLVTSIFEYLVGGSVKLEGEKGVYGMLCDVRGRGVKLSELALRSLLVFADRVKNPEIALEALAMMKNEGFGPTANDYSALFIACRFDKRWEEVIEIYESMPESFRPQLNGYAQDVVIMAHTRNESEEVKLRGLEVFGWDETKWTTYSCCAALDALLQTRQFEALFSLANKMTQKEIRWSPYTFKIVALGYIRSGSVKKALTFMRKNSAPMKNDSARCYRELITYYTTAKRNLVVACQLYKEMMLNNKMLPQSDWSNALELARQLPDQSMHREFRKQQRLQDVLQPASLLAAPSEPSDVTFAREAFEDILQGGGSGLTKEVASKLLSVMLAHNRIQDCVEMLDYFRVCGISPTFWARLAAMTALMDGFLFDEALGVAEDMLENDLTLDAKLSTKALVAATKAKRKGFVTKLSRKARLESTILNNCNAMIRNCTREKAWDVVLDLLAAMNGEGVVPRVDTFEFVLIGCAMDSRWNVIIDVYDGMPDDVQLLLNKTALVRVFEAHARSEREELQQRTLDICIKHKEAHYSRGTKFPFKAAVWSLLEARQYAGVIAIADEAKKDLARSSTMCRRVAVAYICTGAMDQAMQLLHDHSVNFELEDYEFVLNARCRDECWGDVIKIYEDMPESLQSQLNDEALSSVNKARANNGVERTGDS